MDRASTTRRSAAIVVLVMIVLVLGDPGRAAAGGARGAPGSAELVERPDAWDGERITFTGEAVGGRMQRTDGAWLHLNDDAYMMMNVEEGAALAGFNSGMPIWVPCDVAEEVGVFGDYQHQGDVCEVRGIFNAACSAHGGDMDIHAESVAVKVPGRNAADPVGAWKLAVVAALGVAAAALWLLDRRAAERALEGRRTRA